MWPSTNERHCLGGTRRVQCCDLGFSGVLHDLCAPCPPAVCTFGETNLSLIGAWPAGHQTKLRTLLLFGWPLGQSCPVAKRAQRAGAWYVAKVLAIHLLNHCSVDPTCAAVSFSKDPCPPLLTREKRPSSSSATAVIPMSSACFASARSCAHVRVRSIDANGCPEPGRTDLYTPSDHSDNICSNDSV